MKHDIALIQKWLDKSYTMKEIGNRLGVSRQRVYQILTEQGLRPNERKKTGYWHSQSRERQWIWKILGGKVQDTKERLTLLESLDIPAQCPVLGIELDWSTNKGIRTDNSPSLDKIIPELGYTVGNVVVVSWRANRIKNDGTWEEHQKIADFTRKHLVR